MTINSSHYLWGKIGKSNLYPEKYHPLLYHSIDVGMVAGRICRTCLGTKFVLSFQNSFKLKDYEETVNFLAFLVSIHDIGKACPPFQGQIPEARTYLSNHGFDFSQLKIKGVEHGTVSAKLICDLLPTEGTWPTIAKKMVQKLSVALGGHHGVFPRKGSFIDLGVMVLGQKSIWSDCAKDIIVTLSRIFKAESLHIDETEITEPQLALLAGLTTISDWIGSSENYFPYKSSCEDQATYALESKLQAQNAILELGWTKPTAIIPKPFVQMFPACKPLRPLQEVAIAISESIDSPCLIIIEAPMGEGKTEAAIFLADSLICKLKHTGFYIALPTTATSNQIFTRTVAYLQNRFKELGETANIHLVHGQAFLSEEYNQLKPSSLFDEDSGSAAVRAEEWFTSRKRSLLAPFGVGTVDQVLMAALQTRHGFVRLFGLANKVVIIDEVHAYDAYMGTLIQKILKWLKELGSSVIILSATLPRTTKESIIQAWGGGSAEEHPCPRITHIENSRTIVHPVPANKSRAIEIAISWTNSTNLTDDLKQKLQNGGCALVVCNTVNKAQEVYAELTKTFGDKVLLFHARFPVNRRAEIEKSVIQKFGRNGDRPKSCILVATQVVEQSLDLDFDYLVTEMAPIDLMLQRVGRLHRHKETIRPEKLRAPQITIIEPEMASNGSPSFGVNEYIYPKYLLLKTWSIVKNKTSFKVDEEIECLVEEVYNQRTDHSDNDLLKDLFSTSLLDLNEMIQKKESLADSVSIPAPGDGFFNTFNRELDEDENPSLHKNLQALTRDSEPSVGVIFLKNPSISKISPFCTPEMVLDCDEKYDANQQRQLIGSSVQISNKGIIQDLLKLEALPAFKKTPSLRFYKHLVVDETNSCIIGNYKVSIDCHAGITIKKIRSKSMNYSFQLLDEPWIPVSNIENKRLADLSVLDLFEKANDLKEIVHSSPLVVSSLHRFLLAVIYSALGYPTEASWITLWKTGNFPMKKIKKYLNSQRKCFDLFDQETPFYQVATYNSNKPSSPQRLIHELASGNNAVIFDHSYDSKAVILSPADGALYLIASQGWAVGGGKTGDGYPNATHGPLMSGAMSLIQGDTLFKTLLLNYVGKSAFNGWPEIDDQPAWEQKGVTPVNGKESPKGYKDYLTWQTRTIKLHAEEINNKVVVSKVSYAQGREYSPEAMLFDPGFTYKRGKVKAGIA